MINIDEEDRKMLDKTIHHSFISLCQQWDLIKATVCDQSCWLL